MEQQHLSRRVLLRHLCCGGVGAFAALQSAPLLAADGKRSSLSPDEALAMLKDGNKKFLAEARLGTNLDRERRVSLARSQAPFAAVISCSDSRVPPELLFSRGLGELFTIRNAGNTLDTAALGSIEYAVFALGVPLLVVLGHERCGAVDAALAVVEKSATFPGSVGAMVEPIIPAVLQARARDSSLKGEALLDAAVRENVTRTVGRLRNSEAVLREPTRMGKLKIVGARYDLDEGNVEFFEG